MTNKEVVDLVIEKFKEALGTGVVNYNLERQIKQDMDKALSSLKLSQESQEALNKIAKEDLDVDTKNEVLKNGFVDLPSKNKKSK